jgi:transcriptional regulator with XRE-family HTH domain
VSRLETGQRKPSLELLLPIAQAYRVALDDLGGDDLTMKAGEVAEFDTQVPHWFGAAGDQPVEVLSLLSRPGEQAHIRAAPRRKNAR